jgi:hypothetical protein
MAASITVSKLSGFSRGKEVSFEKEQILLGTDPECDVKFDAAWDKTISPRHATIQKRDNELWLTDQSRDGSWVDGRRIGRERIQSGVVVELGKGGPRVKVELQNAAPSTIPVPIASATVPVSSAAVTPAVTAATRPGPLPTPRPAPLPSPRPTFPSATTHPVRRIRPSVIVVGALLAVALLGVIAWQVLKTLAPGIVPGAVTTLATPAPGANANLAWQPVVDMGEEIFPSFIVASATMKQSPFDVINESPSRLGDRRAVIGVKLVNPKAGSTVRVEIAENEIMRGCVYETELPTVGQSYGIYPSPNYRFDALGKIKQTVPLSIAVSLSLNGVSLGQKAKAVRVASINDCPFALLGTGENKPEAIRMDWMFAAYVNENHPISDELRKDALKTGIVPSFLGYQGDADTVYKQVFAIWCVLQSRGVRYSNVTTTPGASKAVYSQYVRFIDQSINNSQANCVDGSIVFASVLRQIGIEPILVLVPGHMFVGFFVDSDKRHADFLETTMLGGVPPEGSGVPNSDINASSSSGFRKDPSAIQSMLETAADTGTASKGSRDSFVAAIKAARGEYVRYFGEPSGAGKTSSSDTQTVRKEKVSCITLSVAKARDMGVLPIAYQP